MRPTKKATVIGGGLVGRCCALLLQSKGIGVILVDPEMNPLPASYGNAGLLAIEQTQPLADWRIVRSLPGRLLSPGGGVAFPLSSIHAWLPFGLRLLSVASRNSSNGEAALASLLAQALPAWRRMLTLAGQRGLMRSEGHLAVWENPNSYRRAIVTLEKAPPSTVSVQVNDRGDLAQMAELTRKQPAGVMRFEGTAQITSVANLMAGLLNQFLQLGGRYVVGEVTDLTSSEERTSARLADGRKLEADAAIVATGVWSKRLLEGLGHRAPLIAERGYHVQAQHHSWPAPVPTVIFEDRALVVTALKEGLRATSYVEFATPDHPADPRKWARIRKHISDLNLPVHDAGASWMGSRPTFPDYLPAIGRSSLNPRIFYACGHQHLGLTLAAISAELISESLVEGRTGIDLAPFRVERFN